MAKPRDASANVNESAATQIVHDLLGKATTRIIYDLDRFTTVGRTAFCCHDRARDSRQRLATRRADQNPGQLLLLGRLRARDPEEDSG